jgi:hypothetical protein
VNAADEEDIGGPRVHAVLLEGRQARHRLILLEVDAVVDDADPLGPSVEEPKDIGFRFLRDGNHCIRHLDCRLLDPEGEVVTAVELLAFPRPKRLETMHREHHRNAIAELRHDSGEMRVPCVKMYDVGIDACGIPIDAALQRREHRLQWFRCAP